MLQYQPDHHFHQGTPLTHTTTWPGDFLEDPAIGPLFVILSTVSLDAWNPKVEWENRDKSKSTNYLQIFIKTVDRLQEDAVHTVNTIEIDQAGLLRKKCMESLLDINCAYYFGHAQEFKEDVHMRRTMGGLMDFNLTEITDPLFLPESFSDDVPGSKINKDMWDHVFAYGPPVRWMFVSEPYWNTYLNKFKDPIINVLGLNVVHMENELGVINIVVDHILDYNGPNLDAVILNLEKLRRRYLKNRDWHLIEIPESQLDPGLDHGLRYKRNDVRYRILGELSLDVIDPMLHYKILKELPKVPKGMREGSSLAEMRAAA